MSRCELGRCHSLPISLVEQWEACIFLGNIDYITLLLRNVMVHEQPKQHRLQITWSLSVLSEYQCHRVEYFKSCEVSSDLIPFCVLGRKRRPPSGRVKRRKLSGGWRRAGCAWRRRRPGSGWRRRSGSARSWNSSARRRS